MNPFAISDFSGGITENYIGGPTNKAKTMENLVVTSNKKIHSRDGSIINDATYYQITDGAVRVGTLIPYAKTDTFFWQYARKLYYINAGFVNLVGPSSNQAFDQAATTNFVRFAEWKKTLYAVCDAGSTTVDCFPIKIYRDGSSVLQLRTAGLPYIPSTENFVPATELATLILIADNLRTTMQTHFLSQETSIFAFINDVKAKMNAHFADALEHTAGQQAAVATANATTYATAAALANALVTAWNTHVTDARKAAAWTYHVAQSLAQTTVVIGGATGYESAVGLASAHALTELVWNQYNPHDANTVTHGTNENTHQTVVAAVDGWHERRDTGAEALITSGLPTNQATLLALTGQLLHAYDFHYSDSVRTVPTVHTKGNVNLLHPSYGENADSTTAADTALESFATPTTLLEAQTRLLDLFVRFTTHIGYYAPHAEATSTLPSVLPTTTISYGPTIAFDPTPLYTAANELKLKLDQHRFREAGASEPHLNYTPVANPTANATTPQTLANLIISLRAYYGEHLAGDEAAFHFGVRADRLIDDPINIIETSGPSYDLWGGAPVYAYSRQMYYLSDLVSKFNAHILRSVPHNADLTDATADEVQNIPPAEGFYSWAFHYEYTYTVGSVTYLDQGPIFYSDPHVAYLVDDYPAVISSIPVFANTSKQNFDTANLKIKIARTVNNGSAYYYCGEVTNGVTTFTDGMSDARLVLQPKIYIEGGVLMNEPPPMAKHIAIVGDIAYYGNVVTEITVDGITTKSSYPYRLMQAQSGDPDSVPGDNTLDFEDEIFLVSSARSLPIVGLRKKLYRVEGSFDLQGRGSMAAVKIDDVGCTCPQSAVEADDGTYFFGSDGIYFTDGYKAICLNMDWPVLYQTLIDTETKRNRIQGVYDEVEKRVTWTVQATAANTENDAFLVLDLQFGMTSMSCFSFWVNGVDFKPTAALLWNGQLLRADARGYVFKHEDTYTSDPKINTSANPSTWAKKAITYNWISTASDFGNPKIRKFVPSMEVFAKNLGNLSLQINRYNDDKSVAKVLTPIRYRTQYTGVIREERMMPAGGLRCSYIQLQFTNALVIITNSDTLGAASVNKPALTVTLDSFVTEDWPADAVDWVIYFQYKNLGAGNVLDNYVTGYTVTVRTADTLTFADPGVSAPSGSVKWILKGVPKDETMELLSFNVNAKMEGGDQQNAFQVTATGANA